MHHNQVALVAFLLLTASCGGAPSSSRQDVARPASPEARAQPEMTAAAGGAADTHAADPTTTDPDKYRLVMENEHVRVLRYHDVPGTRTKQHRHPDSVLYALSAFRRRLIFPDGTTKQRDFRAGDVMWVPAQTHVGENIGKTDTEVLLVEMKRK